MNNSKFKFRAWHNTVKEMLYPTHNGVTKQSWVFDWAEEGQDIIIMQFTGLLDKNGKETFEGDIIEYTISAPWDYEVPLTVRGEVTFDDPFYGCFCVKNKGDATGYLYEYFDSARVIGNIYENPELLNQ